MSDLLKMQKSFYRNIFRLEDDLDFISSRFSKERFDVYRSTIFENMTNALRITYPGIWSLIGEDCANSVAYAYVQHESYLPKTGCLDDFGADFPTFLETLAQLSAIPYLSDYASYEWLKHKAYLAADSNPLLPSDLNNIPEDMADRAEFHFIPSCFLFESKYNMCDIYEMVSSVDTPSVTLKSEKTYGVIGRKDGDVHTYWISYELWAFIKQLHDGNALGASSAYATKLDTAFDLSSAIAFLLKAQLIDKIVITVQ